MKPAETKERLRRQAEDKLAVSALPDAKADGDLRKLIHELQVHQVEQELQNEELNQTREALEQAKVRYEDLYEFAPVGYLSLQQDATIRTANLRGATLLGVDRSALIGRNFKTFVQLPGSAEFASFLENVCGGDSAEHCDTILGLPNGKIINARIDAVFLPAIGECRIALSDTTQLKKAEDERLKMEALLRQSQKMEAIGTFAGGIAHDFNNLLSIIIGYTTLTSDSLQPWSEEKENLDTVLSASNRAKELVKQILSFSRKGEKKVVPLDLRLVVREALRLLESSIPKTVRIECEIDSQPYLALMDPTEMHQVVMNLCANAFQSMPQQRGSLTIRLKEALVGEGEPPDIPGLATGDYLVLEVEDTGSGMDEGTLSRIFEPYFTTKGLGSGTGLGLAVVKGIVDENNGEIAVKSVLGIGTLFSVYLPRFTQDQSVALDIDQEVVPEGRATILFVDDEPNLAKLGGKMLQSLGYQVTVATDPVEAINIYLSNPARFDIIVTDMTMPAMTGAELLRRAKKLRPGMPTVMCTGYSDLIDEQRAKEAKIDAFVRKPYDRNTLGKAVALALAK